MKKIEADPKALAAVLSRIASDKDEGMALLRDHPETKDRIAAINKVTVEARRSHDFSRNPESQF
jgi:predicted Zn-dependent protease